MKITLRENYGPVHSCWFNFWKHCSAKSNEFVGISPSTYVCEHLADEYHGCLIQQGGHDYQRDMWIEFCTEKHAEWFLLRFS
jgi:hypothetical protein